MRDLGTPRPMWGCLPLVGPPLPCACPGCRRAHMSRPLQGMEGCSDHRVGNGPPKTCPGELGPCMTPDSTVHWTSLTKHTFKCEAMKNFKWQLQSIKPQVQGILSIGPGCRPMSPTLRSSHPASSRGLYFPPQTPFSWPIPAPACPEAQLKATLWVFCPDEESCV